VAGATGIGSTLIVMLVTESTFSKAGTKKVGFMGIDCIFTELDVGNLGDSGIQSWQFPGVNYFLRMAGGRGALTYTLVS